MAALTFCGVWAGYFRFLRRGFLDGWPGLICAAMGSYYSFLKYAKLWELTYVRNPEEERKKSSYS